MSSRQVNKQLVSVITPVFNGGEFLPQCIESVLAQTHGHFEYIIADNCSTDDSLSIARLYATRDERISVYAAQEHIGPIQNWNRALTHISDQSAFIKFVHADDWIYPDCIEKMLSLATADERIGIVSAYRLEEDIVSLDQLPSKYADERLTRRLTMSGRDVVRAIFLEFASVLGSPTSVLFRSDVVEQVATLFDESYLHADKEACIRVLKDRDLGFIREVLTFTRRHNESVTSRTNVLDTRRQDDLLILSNHGSEFLSGAELEATTNLAVRLYYGFLAKAVGCRKGREFWRSQEDAFRRAGVSYSRWKLLLATLRYWLDFRTALKNVIGGGERAETRRAVSVAEKYVDTIRNSRAR